LNNNMYKIKK